MRHKTKKGRNNFCFFLTQTVSISILLFFILVELQFAEGNILSIQGKEEFPYFDHQGNFKIAYINSYGGISIATVQGEDRTGRISIQDISYANNVDSIRVKKDKMGKIWLVWKEKEPGKSNIYVARLTDRRFANQISLTTDHNGLNFSPSIDFSLGNDLWVTWVNQVQKKYTILVKNVTANQIWEISPPLNSSVHSPHIVPDGTGRICLFWVGQLQNHDEILCSYFDGERWREPSSLNQYSDVPHITPSVSLDYNGFPYVVWSAYDGDDYELYYSYWDGYKWRQEKRITDNQNMADTFPSVSFLLDTIPIVAWSRYIHEKREVCLTYKSGEEWSPVIRISGDKSITSPPKLICSGERIGIAWQEKNEIKTALIHFYELQEFSFLKKKNAYLPRILVSDRPQILALDKDKYIGFGDSITYGIIEYRAAPEEGYIPRLERLIDENIRDSEVINRGVIDEQTAEGLSRIDSVINEDQAKTIFFMEGTNDIKDFNISLDTVAFNLEQMAQTCLDFGMTAFLASIIPKDLWENYKERILGLNEKIEEIASRLNINFVDMFQAFWNYPDPIYSDATHPNEEGYQIMAETWYEALVNSMPAIELNTTSLSFEAVQGGSNPSSQTFKIRNSGDETLNYQINANQEWISVSPESGGSSGEWDEIEVSVDISNLYVRANLVSPQTSYQGNVTISSENASNSPQLLPVQLTILQPTIELDKTSLSFEGTFEDADPPPQKFKIRNSGAGTLNYQISDDQEWISVSPESGGSSGEWDEIEVSVDISNFTKGDYEGTLTVSSVDASNSPQKLTINLTIKLPPLFPPLNFHGERKKNRSLSQLEYIKILNWAQNPQNKFIEKYNIYLMEGENKTLLVEVSAQTFEYWHRKTDGTKVYKYGLTTGDTFGRESEPVYIEIR